VAIYGKCNNEHFHGHNYTVKVTIRGPVHPDTGMVVNLSSLKEAIRELIVEPFDHKVNKFTIILVAKNSFLEFGLGCFRILQIRYS